MEINRKIIEGSVLSTVVYRCVEYASVLEQHLAIKK